MNKFTKSERSWIFYDWANSVYATIIMAAVFPIYFSSVAKNAGLHGDVMWGYTTSIATFIAAISAPFLGAIGDFKGMKKKLFTVFLFLGIIFTFIMAIADQPVLMLIGYGVSYVGFQTSNLFYDSFLTDVTTHERMDKISAYGYAMGYIGGSTIPFIISIVLITFGENFGIDSVMAVKFSVILACVWWATFSIPMLRNVRQENYVENPPSRLMSHALKNLKVTIRDIVMNKRILYFIVAYFFYIDGVGTVISMATSYGSTLGLGTTGMILALLVTQLVAMPCSILFSRLAERYGTLRMLLTGIIIYVIVCIMGFYMGFHLEEASPENYDNALAFSTTLFWIMAAIVGTSQGGIQALSRSYFGKLIPRNRSNEFFGFFDIFGKFSSVLGPAFYASFAHLTGRSSIGIISLVILFVIGGIILLVNQKHFRNQ
jgi:UMF1 family MFS transporter